MNSKWKRTAAAVVLVCVGAVTLGACATTDTSAVQKSTASDQQASATGLAQLQINQPVPLVNYSQYRQSLITIELAQAHTTQTTSFFFNQGVQDPVQSCPSIGFGIASDTELTNPQQVIDGTGGNNAYAMATIGQADPTQGVYVGNSSGTNVVCVNADGSNYINYWEGFVDTVTGPAVWNAATHQVQMTGPSTVAVATSLAQAKAQRAAAATPTKP